MFRKYPIYVGGILLSTLCLSGTVHAGPISFTSGGVTLTISDEGKAEAQATESAYLASLGDADFTTETFEGFDNDYRSATVVTGVGTFRLVDAGDGGLCEPNCSELAVLDATTTPFKGRFPQPDATDNTQWLDSMDARRMTFTPLAGINSVGFYMSDPNDAGGRFDIGGIGSFFFDDVFGSRLGNGKAFYITLESIAALAPISIYSRNSDDGYGIDSVTIAKVPEPGTLALLGIGLLSLVMLRRRV